MAQSNPPYVVTAPEPYIITQPLGIMFSDLAVLSLNGSVLGTTVPPIT